RSTVPPPARCPRPSTASRTWTTAATTSSTARTAAAMPNAERSRRRPSPSISRERSTDVQSRQGPGRPWDRAGARTGRSGAAGGCYARRVRAAVLYEARQPLRVEELELDGPRDGEVLVRVGAAGVCHSDYHFMNGDLPIGLPCVL